MALGQFVQQTEILVPEVDGVLIKVNPAYSSTSEKIIAGGLGLDIHTASAYVIALKGLKRNKGVECYECNAVCCCPFTGRR